MKRVFLAVIASLVFCNQSHAVEVEHQESKKFPTMKSCVNWLDENFPNYQWHQKGTAWQLWEDTPKMVNGVTFTNANPKTTKSVSIICEYKQTGAQGTFFEGRYAILRNSS